MPDPLERLNLHGQSVWLDYISRELVTSGELERLVEGSHVSGLTSNPTIFEKALAEGADYDRHIRELVDSGVIDPTEVFLGIAISDIQRAADILKPVHERSGGADGFVSLEVLPSLAHDTDSTVATARELWQRVGRPNLMVKIPATTEGVPAIERCIADGININVTLIFSLGSYRNVIDAYLSGLRSRHAQGRSLDVHSVASFFVSRVDTAIDPLLEQRGVTALQGKAAIANAVAAYELFDTVFHRGDEFAELRAAGAHVQRPLWASTSAKNPAYRDVLYAEALVGPETVDTMPPSTIDAFRDHGVVDSHTVNSDYAAAHRVLEGLAAAGIDIARVTEDLLDAGVASFTASYDALIRAISIKIDVLHGGYLARQHFDLGAAQEGADAALREPAALRVASGIWDRDPQVWKPGDVAHAEVIRNRLGWLDSALLMRERLPRLLALGAEMRDGGIKDAVLLGMGGSSLCPEVLRAVFGSAAGHPRLHVLDTTDPEAILTLSDGIDLRSTLFLVASKSGSTLETLSHLSYFWEQVTGAGVEEPGRHFIAITDPGSGLARLAEERSFRHIFENPPDIGGRYSALSFFGMVPAAVLGIDIEALLDRALAMRAQCAKGVPADLSCGLRLGTALGQLGMAGRDKITFLTPPSIAAFSLWAEQLLAESSGKEGRGLIPVGGEPIGSPAVYGDDRLFVALSLAAEDPEFQTGVEALRAAGQPVITLTLADRFDLAAEFFRWEFAIAVAAAALDIDPFDEPNVKESKDNTDRVLAQENPDGPATAGEIEVGPSELREFLRGANPHDYLALMAYVTPNQANQQRLQTLRTTLRDQYRIATTLGFGPRFLHSTGQLHKGGPNSGLYVQLTVDDHRDVGIPGRPFSFSVLKRAQAQGDLESLRTHGRRVLRVHLGPDAEAGLGRLADAFQPAISAQA